MLPVIDSSSRFYPCTRAFRFFFIAFVSLIAASCGGGGGGGGGAATGADAVDNGGGSSSGSDDQPVKISDSDYLVVITFPVEGAVTDGLDHITVTGTVLAMDGILSPDAVEALVVNGVEAELDIETGRWQVLVPLTVGQVDIVPELSVFSGSVEQDSVRINNQRFPADYGVFALLQYGNTGLVYGSNELRYVDLSSGLEESIDITLPDGEVPSFAVDASGQQAYYVSPFWAENGESGYAVLAVDLVNASWRNVGYLQPGPYLIEFVAAYDIDDSTNQLIIAYESSTDGLVASPVLPGDVEINVSCELRAVALESGDERVLLDSNALIELVADGSTARCVDRLYVDPFRNQVVFSTISQSSTAIHTYDMTTGDSRVVVQVTANDLRPDSILQYVRDLLPGDAEDYAYVVDEYWLEAGGQGHRLLRVSLSSGASEIVIADLALPEYTSSRVEYDPHNQRLLVTAADRSNIQSISIPDGRVQELASRQSQGGLGVGSGAALSDYSYNAATAVSPAGDRFYVVDRYLNQLVAIDTDSLQRNVIADQLFGTVDPENIVTASNAVLDATGRYLYFAASIMSTAGGAYSFEQKIISVDLASGSVSELSSSTAGSGLELHELSYMSLDSANRRLYVSARHGRDKLFGLVALDTSSGRRELLYNAGTDVMAAPWVNLIDSDNDRVLFANMNGDIGSLDLGTMRVSTLLAGASWADDQMLVTQPRSLQWDSVAGRVLLAGDHNDGLPFDILQSIDLAAAERQTISDNISLISVDAANDRLFGYSTTSRRYGWVVLDRQSTDRVVVARDAD